MSLFPLTAQAADTKLHLDADASIIMDKNNGNNAGLYEYDLMLSKNVGKFEFTAGGGFGEVNRTAGILPALNYNGFLEQASVGYHASKVTTITLFTGTVPNDQEDRYQQSSFQIHETGVAVKTRVF